MSVGTLNKKTGYLTVADGMVKIGDKAFVRRVYGSKPRNIVIEDFIEIKVRSVHTNKLLSSHYRINQWYSADDVFVTMKAVTGIKIYGNKYVNVGDYVWLWRNSKNYPGLVRKIITDVDLKKNAVRCTYDDIKHRRWEDARIIYASEQDALKACPDQKMALEHALQRIGRRLGITERPLPEVA